MNKHWLEEVFERTQEQLNKLPVWIKEAAIKQETYRRSEVESKMSNWEKTKEALDEAKTLRQHSKT